MNAKRPAGKSGPKRDNRGGFMQIWWRDIRKIDTLRGRSGTVHAVWGALSRLWNEEKKQPFQKEHAIIASLCGKSTDTVRLACDSLVALGLLHVRLMKIPGKNSHAASVYTLLGEGSKSADPQLSGQADPQLSGQADPQLSGQADPQLSGQAGFLKTLSESSKDDERAAHAADRRFEAPTAARAAKKGSAPHHADAPPEEPPDYSDIDEDSRLYCKILEIVGRNDPEGELSEAEFDAACAAQYRARMAAKAARRSNRQPHENRRA